jgi:hypothetical protein
MANTIIPIFTSSGDAEAFLAYPYLFNSAGEWIGFINAQREVYSVLGYYVGILTDDPRIVRRRNVDSKPAVKPLQAPGRLRITSTTVLPKMMSDLGLGNIDVLQEEPERLHTLDHGEMTRDMD